MPKLLGDSLIFENQPLVLPTCYCFAPLLGGERLFEWFVAGSVALIGSLVALMVFSEYTSTYSRLE